MYIRHVAFLLSVLSILIADLACTKAETDAPDEVLVPKLVKQVKTTESIAGVTDISTQVFEYNDSYQIIKRYLKEDISNYESYLYDGDVVRSIRQYRNNALQREFLNPVVVEGNRMTIVTTSAPYADGWVDSVFLQFSFQGDLLAGYNTIVREKSNRREFLNAYTYNQGILTTVEYSSVLNGAASTNNPLLRVRTTDDKYNPYKHASRMNRMLFSIGQIFIGHGLNNVLQYETGGVVDDISYTYDSEGYPLSTTYMNGGTKTVKEYTYTR